MKEKSKCSFRVILFPLKMSVPVPLITFNLQQFLPACRRIAAFLEDGCGVSLCHLKPPEERQ